MTPFIQLRSLSFDKYLSTLINASLKFITWNRVNLTTEIGGGNCPLSFPPVPPALKNNTMNCSLKKYCFLGTYYLIKIEIKSPLD